MKSTCFAGKKVALFGLGASGEVTALALQQGGAHVCAWDDNAASCQNAAAKNIHIEDLKKANWQEFSALILSPGVPLTHPEPHWSVKLAIAAGVEIIGDIELFFREREIAQSNSKCVCITGTNGKSTTTALVVHMLKSLGQNVQMGGNIGVPALQLETPNDTTIHVLEISTFQSDLAPSIAPTIGVLLNLAEDHLDRHGSMEAYARLKKHVVQNANVAVLGQDDEFTRVISASLYERTPPTSSGLTRGSILNQIKVDLSHKGEDEARFMQQITQISSTRALQNGFSLEGTKIIYAIDRIIKTKFELAGIRSLRGAHNAQNAAAALAVMYNLGFTDANALQAALNSFPGLVHRMEEIGQKGKVLFINDSKATNADATQRALASFDNIFWIVGGKDKSDGIEPLADLFPRVKKAYLIGYSATRFAGTLEGKIPYVIAETMENAVRLANIDAAEDAAQESIILLSPACASYDQFKNFEHRGEVFRASVQAILNGVAA